jgi:hypothetical protein
MPTTTAYALDKSASPIVDFVALDDVLVGHLFAGVGVDLGILDAVAGLPIQLVERDILGFGRSRKQCHGTDDERKAQKTFPVRAGAMDTILQSRNGSDLRRTNGLRSDGLNLSEASQRASRGSTPSPPIQRILRTSKRAEIHRLDGRICTGIVQDLPIGRNNRSERRKKPLCLLHKLDWSG